MSTKLLVRLCMVAAFIAFIAAISPIAKCHIAWRGTGYETKYSYFSGCLVQQSNGKWLPEDKVRPE